MKASTHAGVRFLERIMNLKQYTTEQIHNAMQFIERDTSNVEYHNKRRIIIPSFPQFVAIQRDNVIVTIIPKKD